MKNTEDDNISYCSDSDNKSNCDDTSNDNTHNTIEYESEENEEDVLYIARYKKSFLFVDNKERDIDEDRKTQSILYNFLNKHKKKKINNNGTLEEDGNFKPTHTSLGTFCGAYCINDDEYPEFINLYKNFLKTGKEIGMVERPREVGPYLIDVDFRTKSENRIYTSEHIKEIIYQTNEIIKQYINIPDLSYLEAHVQEKDKPTEDKGTFKDGFHIFYPKLSISIKLRYFIYDTFLQCIDSNKKIKNIVSRCINDVSDIFDASIICNNGIMMYGSSKQNRKPYITTHVYDNELNDTDLDELDEDYLFDMACNRNYSDDDDLGLIENNVNVLDQVNDVFRLYNGGKKKRVEVEVKLKQNRKEYSSNNTSNNKQNILKLTNDENLARELSELLSNDRATLFDTWIRVGWALHKISDKLYDAFIQFSKRTKRNNFDERACKTVWDKANDSGYCLPSLCKWAREDSETLYWRVICKYATDISLKAKSGTHDDIACIIYEFFKHQYKCISLKDSIWYEYQEHRWVLVERGYTLFERLSSDVPRIFGNIAVVFGMADNTAEGEDAFTISRRMLELHDNLKNVNYKKNIMTACASKCYDDKFIKNLDTKLYLIGFENGVYDLKEQKFRDGVPEDYITATTGYDYVEYEFDSPEVKEVEDYFKKVLVNDKVREYVLTYISTCLVGTVKDQKFIFWTGTGSNGKSMTVNLICKALGDYGSNLPVTVLTQKRGKVGAAVPELADKNKSRFLYIQEPEGSDKIYVGQMKEITGGDKIYARPLYGHPFYYIPQFKIILCCNRLPEIPSDDGGTWRRIRVVEFLSKFVENPDPNNKLQFKKDPELEERLDQMAQPFIWLLINKYYKKYVQTGCIIDEPIEVRKASESYMGQSDKNSEWFNDYTEKTSTDHIEMIDNLYICFKTWFTDTYATKPPNKKEFITYMINYNYIVEKNRFVRGIKLLNDEKEMTTIM